MQSEIDVASNVLDRRIENRWSVPRGVQHFGADDGGSDIEKTAQLCFCDPYVFRTLVQYNPITRMIRYHTPWHEFQSLSISTTRRVHAERRVYGKISATNLSNSPDFSLRVVRVLKTCFSEKIVSEISPRGCNISSHG